MLIFNGYGVSKGSFVSEKTGETINYSNRLIRGYTDEGLKPEDVGYKSFEQKIRMADLAKCIGCEPKDEVVDAMLNAALGSQIEFTMAFVNGTMAVNGFKLLSSPPEKPLKAMNEVVAEKRESK